MRLTAYKKTLDEIVKLPLTIPELKEYFKDIYNPRQEAVYYLLRRARYDNGLTHGEFIEFVGYERRGEAK